MFRVRVSAFNALFTENDKTSFTIQKTLPEYKLYTKSSTKKEHLKSIQRFFFFIDLKSHLHLKYFEGLKEEKAQPMLEERSAYRQYTGAATNAGTGLTEASSLWPERLAARLLASEASRLSTVDRVGVEVCPCLSDMAAYGFTQVLSPAGL